MSRKNRGGARGERGAAGPAPVAPAGSAAAVAGAELAAPSPSSLAALVGLGVAAALWAAFLWAELVRARAGSRPFCPIGDESGCTALWDSAFASAVHRFTGLPLAGWGLVWGIVALALPLLALARQAEGRPVPALHSAVRMAASAGVVTVFVLVAISLAERAFCFGCSLTYLVVAGYAGIALFGWQRVGLPEAGRGAALAAAGTVVAFLALLYPGARTPRAGSEAAREALEAAPAHPSTAPDAGAPDPALSSFVRSLSPELKQGLSNALAVYRASPPTSLPPPRALLGSPQAPIRITEFTDVLCSHCAELYHTLVSLRQRLPEGSFSEEPRQFPLDGNCNPALTPRGPETVRCVAARARACMEGRPGAHELAGSLYREQRTLTPERVFELAAPYVKRAELEACMASPSTRGRLQDDAALATRYEFEGTPLVLVNGRKGSSFGPFLYAITLARGRADDPAFADLPAPDPAAHVH